MAETQKLDNAPMFVTKYFLTRGIYKVLDMQILKVDGITYARCDRPNTHLFLRVGTEAHFTLEDARKHAGTILQAKIKSTKNLLQKLERIDADKATSKDWPTK